MKTRIIVDSTADLVPEIEKRALNKICKQKPHITIMCGFIFLLFPAVGPAVAILIKGVVGLFIGGCAFNL